MLMISLRALKAAGIEVSQGLVDLITMTGGTISLHQLADGSANAISIKGSFSRVSVGSGKTNSGVIAKVNEGRIADALKDLFNYYTAPDTVISVHPQDDSKANSYYRYEKNGFQRVYPKNGYQFDR